MGKHSNTKAGKHDNLKHLRQCVEKFASEHLPADGVHSVVSKGRRRSRKELRKEARKLKKMRIHAFKQGKPLPTAESLELDRRTKLKKLQEKKLKQQEKQKAQQKKQAEKKKLQEEAERKESEYLSYQKKDEKILKQLEKNLKMKKNKKSLPSAFVQDGLDYILDVVDSEKIKSLSEELNAEALWKDSENCSDQEDETPVRLKSKTQKQSKGSSNDEEDMDVEDEDFNSSGDDDTDDDDDNMDDETDGSEAEVDGSFFTVDEDDEDDDDDGDDDNDDDDDDADIGDEDNIEDGDDSRQKIDKKSELCSKSDADAKTRRLKALADFVGMSSSEGAEVKGILKSKSKTSSKNKDPKQVQFSVSSPDTLADNKGQATSADNNLHEDIYGRLRDERGNVVETLSSRQSSGSVYVPPGKRQQQMGSKTEVEDEMRQSQANVMLIRQLKGQINRLSESNLQSVGNTVESLYRENSRAETTHALTSVILDACLLPSLTPSRVCSDIALLVALLHHRIGSEVSFTILQSVTVRYRQFFDELASAKDSGKQIENALTLICWFYTFKVISCQLLFDLSKQLVARFNERDIELLLILLKAAGFGLRKDNQEDFKKLLNEIQLKASSTDVNQLQDSSRIKFLLDILTNIHSNNDLRLLSLDEKQHLQHLHKLLKVYTKGSHECELRVTLDDVLDATQSGKWFAVGAAWHGPKPSGGKNQSFDDNVNPVATSTVSDKLAKKARKLGMNSEMRRSIFYILATCDNYVDAFEKLIQLSSRQQHQKQREAVYREMVNVVMQLCINEGCSQTESDDNQDINMFYVYLLHRFCQGECRRQVQVAVKFTVRHHVQLVAESDMETSNVMRLAAVVHHLIAKSIIGLAVLKDVDFINISKRVQQFLKRLFQSLLLKQSEAAIETIFRQIAEKPPLLAKQIQLFLKLFLKRGSDDEELQRRIKIADRAMTTLR